MPLNPNQALCATTFGRPLAVMAGAGSGKTFTLKERIANAIQGDPTIGLEPVISGIDEVLAITFTEKAALELKSRIKQTLRQRGRADQALLVDDAWISTIHGMCSRILRENALALGIDPAFRILTEEARDARLEEAFELTFNTDKTVEKDAAALFAEYPRDVLRAMVSLLVDYAVKSVDEFDSLEGASFPVPVAPSLDTEDPTSLFEARLDRAHALWGPLARVARRAYERFVEQKIKDGVFDNNDLLIQAARALRNPGVHERYANRFGLVMVDEFQDTDAMQLKIIQALAGPDAERLCVVGDPQQSIYRFRGADLSVCAGHLDQIRKLDTAERPSVIRLADNYRSHEAVLEFVDVAFGPEVEGRPSEPYAAPAYYQYLHASRDEARVPVAKRLREGEGPRVVVQEVQHRYRRGRAARGLTCALVAKRFRDMHDVSGRPWGDMVILLGSMTHANDYAMALEDLGIPWAITGGSVFSDKLDAKLMVCLARAIANPRDTESLYALLTSDVFGLTEADVMAAGIVVGPREFLVDDGDVRVSPTGMADAFAQLLCGEDAPVTSSGTIAAQVGPDTRTGLAIQVLRRALERASKGSVADAMEGVLVESGWLARMQDDGSARGGTAESQAAQSVGGRSRAANALKAIRMARGVERDNVAARRGVAELLAVCLGCSKEAPGVLVSENNDYVRIMTIHASKGLQFPVVATSELAGGGYPSGVPIICESMAGKTYVTLDLKNSLEGNEALAGCKAAALKAADEDLAQASGVTRATDAGFSDMLRASDEASNLSWRWAATRAYGVEQEAEELERKLYVAFTRAEEVLIVCMTSQITAKAVDEALKEFGGGSLGFDELRKVAGSRSKKISDEEKQQAKEDLAALREHINLTGLEGGLKGVLARIRDRRADVEARGGEYRLVTSQDLELWGATGSLPHAWDHVTPPHKNGEYVDFETAALDELPCAPKPPEGREDVAIPSSLPDVPQIAHRSSATWADAMLSASALHAAEADSAGLSNLGYRGSFEEFDVDDVPAPATEKGTAFHTLGEIAALRWEPGQALAAPTDRIEAVCAVHGLNAAQVDDVREEVARWIASPVAREMASHAHLLPEPPFYVRVPVPGGADVTLDGFIDLMAFDELGAGAAHVVDYKTGRFLDTDEKRRNSYEVQAKCYAYALMLQGFEEVRLSFVFVDQPDGEGHPQVCEFPAPGEQPYDLEGLRAYLSQKVSELR